jgi:hypothetical protein
VPNCSALIKWAKLIFECPLKSSSRETLPLESVAVSKRVFSRSIPPGESTHGSSRCQTKLREPSSFSDHRPSSFHSLKRTTKESKWCWSTVFHCPSPLDRARTNVLYVFRHSCANRPQSFSVMPVATDRVSVESDDDVSRVERDASSRAFVTEDLQSTHVPNTSKNSAAGRELDAMTREKAADWIGYELPASRDNYLFGQKVDLSRGTQNSDRSHHHDPSDPRYGKWCVVNN